MAAPTVTWVNGSTDDWDTNGGDTRTITYAGQAGDKIVVAAAAPDGQVFRFAAGTGSISNDGTALVWSAVSGLPYYYSAVPDQTCVMGMWVATLDVTRTITITITPTAVSPVQSWGAGLWYARGSDGIGFTGFATSEISSANPTITVTTTQPDSTIVCLNADWYARPGARTYRQIDATNPVEDRYDGTADENFIVEAFRYVNAGVAGVKTVGLTAPTAQRYTLGAVEILGTAAGGGGSSYVTVYGSSAPSGTGTVWTDATDIWVGNEFEVSTLDYSRYQCTGARIYVDPALLGSLSSTSVSVRLFIESMSIPVSSIETIDVVAGWNTVTWNAPIDIAGISADHTFVIGYKFLNSEYITYPSPGTGAITSTVDPALFMSARDNGRSWYIISGGTPEFATGGQIYGVDPILSAAATGVTGSTITAPPATATATALPTTTQGDRTVTGSGPASASAQVLVPVITGTTDGEVNVVAFPSISTALVLPPIVQGDMVVVGTSGATAFAEAMPPTIGGVTTAANVLVPRINATATGLMPAVSSIYVGTVFAVSASGVAFVLPPSVGGSTSLSRSNVWYSNGVTWTRL